MLLVISTDMQNCKISKLDYERPKHFQNVITCQQISKNIENTNLLDTSMQVLTTKQSD